MKFFIKIHRYRGFSFAKIYLAVKIQDCPFSTSSLLCLVKENDSLHKEKLVFHFCLQAKGAHKLPPGYSYVPIMRQTCELLI